MADNHRIKRLRRLSTEEDTDASDAWIPSTSAKSTTTLSRPRRAAAVATQAIIDRSSPEEPAPSRSTRNAPTKQKPAAPVRATRAVSGRGRRKPVVDITSSEEEDEEVEVEDEDEEEEEEEMDEDEDAAGEEDEEMVDAEDDDAEGDEDENDAEGEEDEEMEDLPPPPPPPPKKGRAQPKPAPAAPKPTRGIAVSAPAPAPVPVPQAPVIDDSDDDELSSLGSLEDEDEEEEDEEEDAEGEEADGGDDEIGGEGMDVEEEEDAEGELDEEVDSDATPISGSPGGTPDLSRLTRRQRAQYEEFDGGLMALSNEAQKKKHLTAEEHAMRRAEMARRRKNLSEKRNEEEKMDTINRLLKKQAPKRRRKGDPVDGTDGDEDGALLNRPPLGFIRIIQNSQGTRLAVPEEWLDAPVGELFVKTAKPRKPYPAFTGKMVEEVN